MSDTFTIQTLLDAKALCEDHADEPIAARFLVVPKQQWADPIASGLFKQMCDIIYVDGEIVWERTAK